MAKKSELHHKDLKEPDAFFETIGQVNQYVQENRARVITVAVAVVTVFIGGVSWSAYRGRASDRAAATFIRATGAIEDGSLEAAKAGLDNVAGSGQDPYVSLAHLYRAGLAMDAGDYDAAARSYAAVASSDAPEYLRQTALVGKGSALTRSGKAKLAAASYAAAAALNGPHKERALRGQLRAALAANEPAIAQQAIEGILDGFPSSPDADELSRQLADLSTDNEK